MSRLLGLGRNEKGQGLVEFALIFVIIVAITLAVIQFGMILSGQIAVTNAAREGARVAAVGKDDADVLARVKNSIAGHSFVNSSGISVSVTGDTVGEEIKVVVNNASVTTIVPIPSPKTGEANIVNSGSNFPLKGEATMRLEMERNP